MAELSWGKSAESAALQKSGSGERLKFIIGGALLLGAVLDQNATRLNVHVEGEVMPDLLQNEAQAILTGEMRADGTFYASELLLKCPSRYEEGVPEQVNEPGV